MTIAKDIKVSVILPVYNVAPFLKTCLDSIVNQTLKEIEIICVDDGSTDDSFEILKTYEASDDRFKVMRQQNKGAGAARNAGLQVAQGKYLSFLDADDFFERKMLEHAFLICEKGQLDFVTFRSDVYNNEKKTFEQSMWTIHQDLLPRARIFNYLDIKQDTFKLFVGWAWDKLYRREFILQNNLLFQEQRTTNDMLFVFSALVLANRMSVINRILAHHRRFAAQTLSVTREKSWDNFYHALIELRKVLVDADAYERLKYDFINYSLHFSLWNLNTLSGPARKRLFNQLKNKYFKELGIQKLDKNQFYHPGEYLQFEMIMEMSFSEFEMLSNSRNATAKLTGDPATRNAIRRVMSAIKVYGFVNVIRIAKMKLINRMERR